MSKEHWKKANIFLFAFMGICALFVSHLDMETRVTVLLVVAIFFYTKYRGIKGREDEHEDRKG